VELSESEAGWRILVGKEFQRKGAADLKDRLPVYQSSLLCDRDVHVAYMPLLLFLLL